MVSNFKYNSDLEFAWDTVGKDLKNLSHEKIRALMFNYYKSNESVESIVDKFSLKLSSNRLSQNFPKIKTNVRCKYDCDFLRIKLPSRTLLASSNYIKDLRCPICGHSSTDISCNCLRCDQEREKQRKSKYKKEKELNELKRKRIIEEWDVKPYYEINELNLQDKLYLAGMLNCLASESLLTMLPYIRRGENITPFENKDEEIIRSLFQKGYIKVDAYNSDVDEFIFLDNDKSKCSLKKVFYQLNLKSEVGSKELYMKLRHPDLEEFLANKNETLKIWRELAIDECLAYLNYQFERFNFPNFDAGEKTIDTFSNLLSNYSTGQIFYYIYMCVRNAAAYHQQKGITMRRAQNSVITNINRYAARAMDENWTIKNYDIPYNMTTGTLSDIFYNEILGIRSKGRKEIPSIELLREIDVLEN